MAGDWIKMRLDLPNDPAVYKIASLTKLDRLSVIGRLYAFWSWADKYAVDGRVDDATPTVVDDVTRHDGFSDAMVSVRWLAFDDAGLTIPHHERHNGESAKERALKNARQARWRGGKGAAPSTPVDAEPSTDASTREEKRREEKKEKTAPDVALPEWMPGQEWTDFIAHRKAMRGVPFTEAARRGVIRDLEKLKAKGYSPADLLSRAVTNGWRTVFEPKLSLANPADVARVTVPGPPPSTYLADQAAHRAVVEAQRLARKAIEAA